MKKYLSFLFKAIFFQKSFIIELEEQSIKIGKFAAYEAVKLEREKLLKQYKSNLDLMERKQYLEKAIVIRNESTPLFYVDIFDHPISMSMSVPDTEITINRRRIEKLQCSMEGAPIRYLEHEAVNELSKLMIDKGFLDCDTTTLPGRAIFSINVIQ